MKILVTSELPGKTFEDFIADSQHDILILSSQERVSLKKQVEQFNPDGMITLLSDKVDRELIDLAPNLKVISNYAVGFNNIDVEYCSAKNITVTNTPDVLTDSTADIAILLLLMASRRAIPSDSFTRAGNFSGWGPSLFLGRSLRGKTLGLFGFGRIGQAVARRAASFGMKIIYWSRSRKSEEIEAETGAVFTSFDQALRASDMISLHLPYISELHHLFGKNEFEKIKKGTVFINTARGKLIDEAELAENIKNGKIYAAGFDVYEFEPQINNDLKSLDNVILFPHIGSATEETRAQMADMVISDCTKVLAGLKADNPVK